jgi:hypothetical protein
LNRILNETILETQEESENDDEIVFKLLIDGKVVSWAKTTLYSHIDDIHTACLEKGKGHGQKLLKFIEKNAKAHSATSMSTCQFDPSKGAVIFFFKKMGYTINSPPIALTGSVDGTKLLK